MEIAAFIIGLLLWCLYWSIYWTRKHNESNKSSLWWDEAKAEAKKQVKQVKQAKVWKDDNDA